MTLRKFFIHLQPNTHFFYLGLNNLRLELLSTNVVVSAFDLAHLPIVYLQDSDLFYF